MGKTNARQYVARRGRGHVHEVPGPSRSAMRACLARLPHCDSEGMNRMEESDSSQAQRIARAAMAFEQQTTGRLPGSVTVVLGEDTVVITLRAALSPAEMALAKSTENAARLRELHRHLFTLAAEPLRREIRHITGVEVREATVEVETSTGTVVQVFLLERAVPAGAWSGSDLGAFSPEKEFDRWADDGGGMSRIRPEES